MLLIFYVMFMFVNSFVEQLYYDSFFCNSYLFILSSSFVMVALLIIPIVFLV